VVVAPLAKAYNRGCGAEALATGTMESGRATNLPGDLASEDRRRDGAGAPRFVRYLLHFPDVWQRAGVGRPRAAARLALK
jgi:hypothetical protein